MSRRSYKTVNLPRELAEFLRAQLDTQRPIGIASVDEFTRVAVAILAASVFHLPEQEPPMKRIETIIRQLQDQATDQGRSHHAMGK